MTLQAHLLVSLLHFWAYLDIFPLKYFFGRAFVENNYKDLKTLNPKLPIWIRECSGTILMYEANEADKVWNPTFIITYMPLNWQLPSASLKFHCLCEVSEVIFTYECCYGERKGKGRKVWNNTNQSMGEVAMWLFFFFMSVLMVNIVIWRIQTS